MARKTFRKHKVALRPSHVQYQWRVFWLTLLTWGRRVFLTALFAWVMVTGYAWWDTAEVFRVQRVDLGPGAPAGLADRLGAAAGDHLFRFSARQAEARLLAEFPQLLRVDVERRWDRSLRVSAERRVPQARVPVVDGFWGMDNGGTLFPLAGYAETEKLPVFFGVNAGAGARSALRFWENLRKAAVPWAARVTNLKVTPPDDVTLYFADETPLYWGSLAESGDVVRRKALRLERVLSDEALSGGVEYVRFVEENRLAAKPKESAPPPAVSGPSKNK